MTAAIYCPQIKRADRVADESRSVKETTAHAGESFHDSGRNRHAGLVSFCLSERLFSGRTSSQNHLRENPSLFRGEPMDETALHVENLREALRQTQRHIVTAIGASASLVFLERGIASVSEGGMTIPPLGVVVALSATAIYLSATCSLWGSATSSRRWRSGSKIPSSGRLL